MEMITQHIKFKIQIPSQALFSHCTHRWRRRAAGASPRIGPGTASWSRGYRAWGCRSKDSPLSGCWLHTSKAKQAKRKRQHVF